MLLDVAIEVKKVGVKPRITSDGNYQFSLLLKDGEKELARVNGFRCTKLFDVLIRPYNFDKVRGIPIYTAMVDPDFANVLLRNAKAQVEAMEKALRNKERKRSEVEDY